MTVAEDSSAAILKEFGDVRPIYEAFTAKVDSLIRELLTGASIDVHAVTSRTKEPDSLADKLRSEGKYEKLTEVTDLSGVRVTCLLLDQVAQVEKVIRENFEVNEDLSVNKLDTMDPDRFGYLSAHFIISLHEDRNKLSEFKPYAGLSCEIQVRTILQDVWAEIEHDLGYKSKIEIPKNIKRRFYRLAGLLELADDEFQHLQSDIQIYREKVNEKIENSDQDILVDKISLSSYMENSNLAKRIDTSIAAFFHPEMRVDEQTDSFERDLKIIDFFKIKTIKELDESLRNNEKQILTFAKKWIGTDDKTGKIGRGISIFYLGYYLAAYSKDSTRMQAYIDIFGFKQDVFTKLTEFSKNL